MNNEKIKPIKIENCVHIDMSKRLYLAVARKTVSDKLIYVYTLGCPGCQNASYYLVPTTDMATFNNQKAADLYTNSVRQVIQAQSQWAIYSMALKASKQDLANFKQMAK